MSTNLMFKVSKSEIVATLHRIWSIRWCTYMRRCARARQLSRKRSAQTARSKIVRCVGNGLKLHTFYPIYTTRGRHEITRGVHWSSALQLCMAPTRARVYRTAGGQTRMAARAVQHMGAFFISVQTSSRRHRSQITTEQFTPRSEIYRF